MPRRREADRRSRGDFESAAQCRGRWRLLRLLHQPGGVSALLANGERPPQTGHRVRSHPAVSGQQRDRLQHLLHAQPDHPSNQPQASSARSPGLQPRHVGRVPQIRLVVHERLAAALLRLSNLEKSELDPSAWTLTRQFKSRNTDLGHERCQAAGSLRALRRSPPSARRPRSGSDQP